MILGVASHKSLFSRNALHFNDNNRHSMHTNAYIFACHFKTFSLSLVLVLKVKTVFITSHIGCNCVITQNWYLSARFPGKTLSPLGVCLPYALYLSPTRSPLGCFTAPTVRVYMCISANRLQRLSPTIWNLDIVELIGGMQSATDWEGMM